MSNRLVHVTNFPYNSVVPEMYLLVSDGKKVASVAFVTRDSANSDDAIEVRVGNDEPYEVPDLEEGLEDLAQRFGNVDGTVDMTFGQAQAAGLIG